MSEPWEKRAAERILDRYVERTSAGAVHPVAPSSRVRELSARPKCAVCGTPVQRMTEEELDHKGEVRFTAYCHGERESVDMPAHAAGVKTIDFGVAFAGGPKRLTPGGGT